MGLFSRKQKERRTVPPPPPSTASRDDLDLARRVIQDFLAVVGNDARMRQTASAFSRAGGGPADVETALRNTIETGQTGMDRPWHWLAAVCREARSAGDVPLIAAIALFVNIWDAQLRDVVELGDINDMMLAPPPAEVVTEVYAVAVLALPEHAVNQQVASNASGTVRMGDVRLKCALDLLGGDHHVSPEARAAAQRILDR
ncbi:hypothetical protein [Micromonospora sp. WMMC273]|uniref:hypothetical protein n=1 Tax=Micromonospora sp. WMMC273 TaxID=3015157 RepID=UPI0022B734B0|nr:hypothetical protein [Micromonospora sp. WMMC273]MCZ7474147.1 hypothetical protein [Micromonospora sp. WMMC273]